MYIKAEFCFVGTGEKKLNSVSCEFSPIKIDYSDYQKRFIIRINEVVVF